MATRSFDEPARQQTARDKSPYAHGDFWLDKRRDRRSDVWMIAWYDPNGRLVRYRSTRTLDLEQAKAALARFVLSGPNVSSHRPLPRRESGKVYFIAGDVGGIKIGLAADPVSRMSQHQCGSPIKLRLLAVADGGRTAEREYHRRFAAHRLHGEWFERHPDILAEIERIAQHQSEES